MHIYDWVQGQDNKLTSLSCVGLFCAIFWTNDVHAIIITNEESISLLSEIEDDSIKKDEKLKLSIKRGNLRSFGRKKRSSSSISNPIWHERVVVGQFTSSIFSLQIIPIPYLLQASPQESEWLMADARRSQELFDPFVIPEKHKKLTLIPNLYINEIGGYYYW